MNLTPYVESVRNGVSDAAALADDHTRQVASRLGSAISASTRLALIDALCDAADAISADLAPGSVVVRMAGSEPQFIVERPPAAATEPTLLLPPTGSDPEPEESAEVDDEPVARISLRLPASVKARVDEMADRDQISTNAWLLRAVMDALSIRRGTDGLPAPPEPPAAPAFGVHGPFGPHGVFGAHGPFGPGGLFGAPSTGEQPEPRKNRGSVRGWVR